MPPGATLDFWSDWLDRAGTLHPDVVLLPELFDGSTPATPSAPDGPMATLLAAKAAQWGMYTCGAFYQERDGLVYNTAPLYGRTGILVGAYDKVMPFDPELDAGVVPGGPPPTWTTDFGRVGILTCYDAWFPETARCLAVQGANWSCCPTMATGWK
ncbi:MAG: carbon-nitrogen hydrolase family protein [Candidatus Solibacter sp.]